MFFCPKPCIFIVLLIFLPKIEARSVYAGNEIPSSSGLSPEPVSDMSVWSLVVAVLLEKVQDLG
jgi:hypothetical protein